MIRRQNKRQIKVNKKCYFCESDTTPYYQDLNVLNKYVTERGKLIARSKTGLCGIHQRRLEQSVKRARFMAMLPFVVRA